MILIPMPKQYAEHLMEMQRLHDEELSAMMPSALADLDRMIADGRSRLAQPSQTVDQP